MPPTDISRVNHRTGARRSLRIQQEGGGETALTLLECAQTQHFIVAITNASLSLVTSIPTWIVPWAFRMSSSIAKGQHPPPNGQDTDGSAMGRSVKKTCGLTDFWAYANEVALDLSRPGKPTDNGFIEAFNSKLRTKCLNAHCFMNLADAREKLAACRRATAGCGPAA